MNTKNVDVVMPSPILSSLNEPPATLFQFHRFYKQNNKFVIQEVDVDKIFNRFGEIRADVIKLGEKIDEYEYNANNPMTIKSINRLIKQLL